METHIPENLRARLARLGVAAEAVEESFARSGGPGGQHVNKVETAVRLSHRASGISVLSSIHRSRQRNRADAWERLVEKLEDARAAKRQQALAEKARARRRRARRSPAAKRKLVEAKRRRSAIKELRRKPGS